MTMATRARHGGYLFQRPGSANYYVKLRSPGKRLEQSLHTSDKLQAEIAAAPLIAAHKAALLAARPRLVASWQHAYEPGREHAAPDGVGRIIATDRELIHIGHNGAITRTEPNGFAANRLENFPSADTTLDWARLVGPNFDRLERPTVPNKNGDDAILETYLKHANVTGYYEREARAAWSLYQTLVGKPLKDCDRDSGRKLVAHFESQGLKSATIKKKLMWLRAACNLAIREGKLKFNPFSGIVPNRDDAERRLPLDDADILESKNKSVALSDADQLLFRLLASTGMRLGEAFQIDGEATEGGVRFCIVGSKTDQSLRRVPLPADLLPHLPATIKGPLFARTGTLKHASDAASKRLMHFLRDDCAITDPRKVVHSLRHRAQDRLRAAECPQDIRWAILGHEEKTVAAGYGEGFSVTILRKWIDRIGF
jgi:integrase